MKISTEPSKTAARTGLSGAFVPINTLGALVLSLFGVLLPGIAIAQSHAPILPVPVPPALISKVAALGDRFAQGNERIILSGTIAQQRGSRSILSDFRNPAQDPIPGGQQ